MEPLVLLFVSALAGGENSPGGPGRVRIIVAWSRPFLAELLAKAIQGREDAEGIVERRRRDGRTQEQSVGTERRRAQRRRPNHEDVEVVRGAADRPSGPPER